MGDRKLTYSLEEAIEYGENGNIEEWVHSFLLDIGNNKPFSDGLYLQERYWTKPIKVKLSEITRCCGPEKELKFYEPEENFNRRVDRMVEAIKEGWIMPPLIVNHDKGILELNDGNHRHEALVRAGIEEYWVIFWDSDSQESIDNYIECSNKMMITK